MSRAPQKSKPQIGPGKCTLCPRHTHCHVICMVGYGPKRPELVCVGEGPAFTEDQWCQQCQRPGTTSCWNKQHIQGKPFVGASGQLLHKALTAAGFHPKQVFFTNIVRCAGPNPTMLEVRKCKHYLLDELRTLDYSRCRGIILLGQTAVRGVLDNGAISIKEARLRELDTFGPPFPVPLRCTFHPAAALPGRNPALYDEIVEDLRSVWAKRDPLKLVHILTTSKELESILGHPQIIGLDLEWRRDGSIRAAGVSGETRNVVCAHPDPVLEWIHRL